MANIYIKTFGCASTVSSVPQQLNCWEPKTKKSFCADADSGLKLTHLDN